MRKTVAVVIGAALMALAGAGAAFAGSTNQTAPGTPGTASCGGQTMANLAQGNDAVPGPGIGDVASQAGLTVQQVKAIVDAHCA